MNRSFVVLLLSGVAMAPAHPLLAQPTQSPSDRVQAAAKNLEQKQAFLLRYKFEKDEQIRWDVEHVATTQAKIADKDETTSSRTQSTKVWRISNIDSLGNITFVHSVESTTMWQQIGEEPPISYDSQSRGDVPDEFIAADEMIGKPLAVITITPSGKVVDRKSGIGQFDFGIGDICTPMPEKPVAIGHRWYVPTDFTATDEDGKRLQLKARLNYQLTKVVEGKAYIAFRTEVLTPIENDKVKSQLLQKLTNGYIAFDMKSGRIAKKEIEWNEKVQEYAGPDSFLQYTGRMTEQLVTDERAQDGKPRVSSTAPDPGIKRPDDPPVIRK